MKKTHVAAVLAALSLSLSACGSSSGGSDQASSDDATAAKNLSANIMKSQKGSQSAQFLSMDKKDADCIGKGLVDKIGTDQLQKYKLIDKNLKVRESVTSITMSASDAKSATSVLFGCTDVESMMKTAITKSGSVPKTMQACVDKALTEDNLRGMFNQIFQGDTQAAQQKLVAPMTKCATGSAG